MGTASGFQAHRADYENYLVEPAREFVIAVGDCLRRLGSDIQLPGLCFELYQRVAPLQQWLVDLLAN